MKKLIFGFLLFFCLAVVTVACTTTPGSSSSSSSGGSSSSSSSGTLIPLNSGAQMTVQFVNKTGHADSDIYILVLGHTNQGLNAFYFYLDKNGNFKPCIYGEYSSSYSMKLSDINGLQMPKYIDSGRIWISIGSSINGLMSDKGTSSSNVIGWAQPAYDSSYYFESFELAIVISNQVNCNCSEVDCFSFPYKLDLYTNAPGNTSVYGLYGSLGFSNTRSALMNAWDTFTASSVDKLKFADLKTTYRILSPNYGATLNVAGNLSNYFDSYISNCWTYYETHECVLSNGSNSALIFKGGVNPATGVFTFTNQTTLAVTTINEPINSMNIWRDDGDFVNGAGQLLATAFHRGVVTNNPAYIWLPAHYYQSAPCDWYAKFLHDYAISNLAYGFSYDDENNQNPSFPNVNNPRGVIVELEPF